MKLHYLLFSMVAALLVVSNAYTSDVNTFVLEATNTLGKMDQPGHPAEVVDVKPTHYPVRFDSADLDSFIRYKMETTHIAGVATWINKHGQVIWQQCHGYANLEDSIEVTDSTSFMLASISKTFVGTAIMQLWERNLFELDDDINDYLSFNVRNPNHPDSAITFRMLMTHTSSIHDNWSILDPLWQPGDPIMPTGEFLHEYLVPGGIYYSMANFNDSVPGVYYDYGNTAIALLAYLVEEMEDSFPVYCQDSIFEPLGMNHTSWLLAGLDTSNIAVRYHWTGTYYQALPHIGHPIYPCAQLRASMVDLAQHLTAIIQYGIVNTVRILDSATVDLMLSPHFIVDPYFTMGLTWTYQYWPSRWMWCHAGNMTGVSTFYGYSPAESTAVIVLTNGDSWSNGTVHIVNALFYYAQQYGIEEFESSMPPVIALQVSPNPFRHHTDIRYQISDNGNNVTAEVHAELRIHDVAGRLVKSFTVQSSVIGDPLSVKWDGTDQFNRQLGSGIYFLQLKAGDYIATEKVLLIR